MRDIREGAYFSGGGRLWYVLAILGDESLVIEDCQNPDEPELWNSAMLFLTTFGPLEVVRP